LNLPAIEATLKDLQKEKDDLLRQKGAGEARAKRLATIQGQLEKIGVPALPPADDFIRQLQQDLQDTKNALEVNAKEIEQAAVKNQSFPAICPAITLEQIPCPKAGQKVGAEPTAPGVLEALTQNRQGLIKKSDEINTALSTAHHQVESYRATVEKKKSLEEEQIRLQSEPEAGADLDAEIAIRQRRIERGQAFQAAVDSYNIHLAQYQDTLVKLAAAEQEVIIYDALQKALAPDGIPSQMIAEALDGINELLEEAANYFFPGRYLHLTGELNIVLQNSPYITLSKSAKYRVGIAFQYALARLTGARVLLIDEADILDGIHQTELVNFLLYHLSDFDQILVFATQDMPAAWADDFDSRAQSWWLENGEIKPVSWGGK
jgi:DNA repair exonuclease SbcCD ATPase subunit